MHEASLREPVWPLATLAETCELVSRGTAPTYDDDGNILVIGQRCIQPTGFHPSFLKRHRTAGGREVAPVPGDVLLNSTGFGTIGRSCLFNEHGLFIVDSHVTVIRPGHNLDGRWLDLLLRSFWGQRRLESHCFVGSTGQIELSRSELLRVRIPLPPIGEQRRVAEILDEVDTQIDLLYYAKQKKRSVVDGVRYRLLQGDDSWKPATFGDLGMVTTGRTPIVEPNDRLTTSIPFVTPSEITDDGQVLHPRRVADPESDGVVAVPAGATLAVCIGFGIGKIGFLKFDACINQQINALIPADIMDPIFAFNLISSASHEVKARSALQVTPIINKSTFSEIPIKIPDFAVQTRTGKIIADTLREIDAVEAGIRKLEVLKRSLMGDLLTGKIRTLSEL